MRKILKRKFWTHAKQLAAGMLAIIVMITAMPQTVQAADFGLGQAEDGAWYYYNGGQVDYNYNGFVQYGDAWWCVAGGRVAFEYTGLWSDPNVGWWYVENGMINFGYNGLVEYNGGWWCVAGGRVAFEYTGLWSDPNVGWWYVENGMINFGYNGLIEYNGGWWCVAGGQVIFDYTGLWSDPYVGWWYVENGMINFNYNGLIEYNGGWWCIAGGQVIFDYTGLWSDPYVGWWYVENGMINFGYNGLIEYNGGWWCVAGGQVIFDYTGLWNDPSVGMWYVENGMINFNYNGQVQYNGTTYNVVNGKAEVADNGNNNGGSSTTTFPLGSKATGTIGNEKLYILQSKANRDYALTVVEDSSSPSGYNVVMAKIDGSNAQKFLVYQQSGGTYMLLNQAYKDSDGNGLLLNALHFGYDGGMRDNVAASDNSVGGQKLWYIQETSTSGDYKLLVPRTDEYKFYLNVEDTNHINGANVGTAQEANSNAQIFSFVEPYTKTLSDGIYQIAASSNTNLNVAAADASVKDSAKTVLAQNNGGSEQLYYIECSDAQKSLYRIINMNSQRVLETDGTWTSGTDVFQNVPTGYPSQYWYVQQNDDNTYSFVSSHSYQYLTIEGNAVNGTKLVQATGRDTANQKFVLTVKTVQPEALDTGVYSTGSKQLRFEYVGYGLYSIKDINADKYIAVESNGTVKSVDNGNSLEARFYVTLDSGKAIVQSASSGKYLTAQGSVSGSTQKLSLTNVTYSISDYTKKYDLDLLENVVRESNTQIVTRVKNLGLSYADYMKPTENMQTITSTVENALKGLPTETVQFTGNDGDSLTRFMRNNQGKIVVLTQDVKINNKGTGDQGTLFIPSNVVLDGAGHSLVLEAGGDVPNVAVAFFYFDASGNQHISQNAGVKNLTIQFACNTQICTFGADNILIEGNVLKNAVLNPIAIMSHEGNDSSNIKVKNNQAGYCGSDAIAVYGEQSNVIIEGNTVSTVGGRAGIMVSCFADGVLGRVDSITGGPHDVIVTGNNITNCYGDRVVSGEGLYCLGSYKVYITKNVITNSALEGVCFDNGCVGTYFAENEVYNNGTTGGFPGVSIDNGAFSIVDNNKIYNNSCSGVKLVRTGLGNVIVNNYIANNNTNVIDYKTQQILADSAVDIENLKPDVTDADHLDGKGSDYNYIINNNIVGHSYGIYIADDSTTGVSTGNFACFNTWKDCTQFGTIDYSSGSNVERDNARLFN